ncbi:MAG TPA: sulfatase-like hydrolase/transferase [Chitinophagaceae bacterium]
MKLLLSLIILISFCFSAQSQRPNIIYIMADDLGYADLSCYGRKDYQTPNLDKLASQGIKLMNAYAAAPLCTPTRVAFMTGRYSARTPIGLVEPMEWSARDSARGLTPDQPSIATRLKKAGYETYLIGKWHLGFAPAFSPMSNGFDYFYGIHGGGIDYVSHRSPRGGANDLYENDKPVEVKGYMTDLLMQKAVDVINKPRSKPFFLNIMFNAPHWPWQAPGDAAYHDTMPWRRGGTPEVYAGMMRSMDSAVGVIMKLLDDKDLAKNTIVIFTSDNGGERFSDMSVYRNSKGTLWEGGVRVPAFIRWPGKIKPNTVSNQVASTFDWTATILSAANAKPEPSFPLDGMDLMPVLTGNRKEIERTLYWRSFQRINHKSMRDGKWKYMRDEKDVEYLFDLVADPSEKNDVKANHPQVFEQLKAKYALWESKMLKPVPL